MVRACRGFNGVVQIRVNVLELGARGSVQVAVTHRGTRRAASAVHRWAQNGMLQAGSRARITGRSCMLEVRLGLFRIEWERARVCFGPMTSGARRSMSAEILQSWGPAVRRWQFQPRIL